MDSFDRLERNYSAQNDRRAKHRRFRDLLHRRNYRHSLERNYSAQNDRQAKGCRLLLDSFRRKRPRCSDMTGR